MFTGCMMQVGTSTRQLLRTSMFEESSLQEGGRLSLSVCATLRLTPSSVSPHSAVQIVFAFYCDIRHVSCQSAPLMEHRRLASRRLHASVRACFAPPCILHHAASRYILEALHRSIGFRVDATMTSYVLVPPLPPRILAGLSRMPPCRGVISTR